MGEIVSYFQQLVDWKFALLFLVGYLFLIWISVIVWVLKDISIRTNNIFFQIFCVLLVFIGTPFAVFIYLIVRPGKTLYEKYYDEIEDNLEIIADLLEERRLEKEQGDREESSTKKGNIADMFKKSIQKKQQDDKQEESLIKKPEGSKEKKYKLLAKTMQEPKKQKTTLRKRKF